MNFTTMTINGCCFSTLEIVLMIAIFIFLLLRGVGWWVERKKRGWVKAHEQAQVQAQALMKAQKKDKETEKDGESAMSGGEAE